MGAFAGGFIKGLLVGVSAFALGFAALSVILPPEPPARQSPAAGPVEELSAEAPTEADAAAAPEPAVTPPDRARDTAALPPLFRPTPRGEQAAGNDSETDPVILPEAAMNTRPSGGTQAADFAPQPPSTPTAPVGEPSDGERTQPTYPTGALDVPVFQAPDSLFRPTAETTEVRLPQIELPPPAPSPSLPVTASPDVLSDLAEEPAADPPTAESAPEEAATDESATEEESATDEAETGRQPSPPETPRPLLRPGSGLERTVEGVVTGRLPSIGAPTADADASDSGAPGAEARTDAADAEAAPAASDDPAPPAHIRYAAPYEIETERPLLSVILVDDEADEQAEAAIMALDFPVSVALDPADPDATRRAAAYRAAGHEVMILGRGLPSQATPTDIEVTFSSWSAALPEAVALLDPADAGIQGNAVLARQVIPALADRGLGLVLPGGGLGGARQAARAEAVVNAAVFRDIDQSEENRHTIQRYIDRAVFEAQRQGGVVVLGRAEREETMAALDLWRREGRADAVTMAPASALMRLD